FENPNETNMRGENQSSSQVALVGDVDFGAITFDVSTGKAVVVLTDEILGKKFDASSQDAEPFDFSGTWLVKALPKDKMPEGYVPPCRDDKKGDGGCMGPAAGEVLWFNRIAGKEFTPDKACKEAKKEDLTECNGTTGEKEK